MKKTISLLLVLCCLISAIPFCASAEYDDEILFRDIPWGLSYQETIDSVTKSIKESGGYVSWSELESRNYTSIGHLSQGSIDLGDYETIGKVYSTGINLKIANHQVERINLYFVYEFDGKKLLQNKEHAFFYMATYTIKNESGKDPYEERLLFEDLLKELYGDYDDSGVEGLSPQYIYRYFWGDNDTELVFTEEIHIFSGDKIYIGYVWKNGDLMAKSAYDSLKEIERANALEEAKKDTKGL